MQIGIHPAPGLGELLPGWFVVPSNPIAPVSYVPTIGELLPARFTLPENPIVRELAGLSSLAPGARGPGERGEEDYPWGLSKEFTGQGHAYGRGHPVRRRAGGGGGRNLSISGLASCGCVGHLCGGGCEGVGEHGGMEGLGFLGLESITPFLPWLIGGGLLLWALAPGGKGYRSEVAAARQAYRTRVAKAKSHYRGYRRALRAGGGAVQRGLEAAAA